MLSRANSDAGNRLRRAKSSSSVQYRRSEPSHIPPNHHQAEVAAVEAFRRHNRQAYLMTQVQQSMQSDRGQGKKKRSSEGSHFEESRNGVRVGTSQAGGLSRSQSKKMPRKSSSAAAKRLTDDEETTTVTRPRRVVDTSAKTSYHTPPTDAGNERLNNQRVRKSQSMYGTNAWASDLSKTERPKSAVPHSTRMEMPGSSSLYPHLGPASTSIVRRTIPRKPVASSPATEVRKASARDEHLQDFHKKIRTKPSFIDPIKARLRKPSLPQLKAITYDKSVPPFNLVNDTDDVFRPAPVVEAPPAELHTPKTRVLSDSIKSRFRRILGKGKRVQTTLPLQQVTATQYHFDLEGSNDDTDNSIFLAPNRPAPTPPGTSSARNSSSSTTANSCGGQADTSRVTSWTNSTTANTIRSLPSQQMRLSSINESGAPDQNAASSSRNRSSMLGRALRLPHRRQSRSSLKRSSEESQDLYNALRKQIGDFDSLGRTSVEGVINGSPVPSERVVVDHHRILAAVTPTQDMEVSPTLKRTIRTVTTVTSNSDVDQDLRKNASHSDSISRNKLDAGATVNNNAVNNCDQPSKTPRSVKHASSADATPPEGDWLARRYERSQNRWQSPLQAESPILSRAVRHSSEHNPYELAPYSSTEPPPDLPTVIRHDSVRQIAKDQGGPKDGVMKGGPPRGHVISPSIYSRNTADSTAPNSPYRGTVITITGREIKTYTLTPPKEPGTRLQITRPRPSHE